jgi:hypothetical protein
VRSTTLRALAPAGRSRGFQSVLRNPAVAPPTRDCSDRFIEVISFFYILVELFYDVVDF